MGSTGRRRGGEPEPLDAPPVDLDARPLPLVTYNRPAYRVHRLQRDPVHFGRARRWRFDDPLAQYGVMYVAETAEGAFAETLLPRPGTLVATATLAAGSVPVTATTIAIHALAEVACRSLQCVDLTGPGLASIGADARIAAGPWQTGQVWSRALFTHPTQPDALLYRARRDPSSLALAIHDRAAPKVNVVSLGSLSAPQHAPLLARIAERYQLAILPT